MVRLLRGSAGEAMHAHTIWRFYEEPCTVIVPGRPGDRQICVDGLSLSMHRAFCYNNGSGTRRSLGTQRVCMRVYKEGGVQSMCEHNNEHTI